MQIEEALRKLECMSRVSCGVLISFRGNGDLDGLREAAVSDPYLPIERISTNIVPTRHRCLIVRGGKSSNFLQHLQEEGFSFDDRELNTPEK